MEFALNDEQRMLQDSVRAWTSRTGARHDRPASGSPPSSDEKTRWTEIAELGWLGVLVPPEYGGLGGDIADAAVIAEQLGAGLSLEPFAPIAVLAADVLRLGASDAQCGEWLNGLAAGTVTPVLAHNEADAHGNPSYVSTRAIRTESGGYRLSGRKTLILGAEQADLILVSARDQGDESASEGIVLFALDAADLAQTIRGYRTIDFRTAQEIVLDQFEVSADRLLQGQVGALAAIETAYAKTIAVLCAENVGAMESALWMTRDYLRVREQFGVPLASFQALKHRCADMFVALEKARSVRDRALAYCDNPDHDLRQKEMSAAKAEIHRLAFFVCAEAIQLHGGIGMTEEYLVGHYLKRIMVNNMILGGRQDHLSRLSQAH